MGYKSTSTAQKVYDECHLQLSTAKYYQSQGNDKEAIRSLRSVYYQLKAFNTSRSNATSTFLWRAPSEAEKSLERELMQMEQTTKEQLDIAEALRRSKIDVGKKTDLEGELAPPLPVRPAMDRTASSSSSLAVHRSTSNGTLNLPTPTGSGQRKTSRNSSPEKKGFPTTLRTGDRKKRNTRLPEAGLAASRAAANAWIQKDPRLSTASPRDSLPVERSDAEFTTGDDGAFTTARPTSQPPPPYRNSLPPGELRKIVPSRQEPPALEYHPKNHDRPRMNLNEASSSSVPRDYFPRSEPNNDHTQKERTSSENAPRSSKEMSDTLQPSPPRPKRKEVARRVVPNPPAPPPHKFGLRDRLSAKNDKDIQSLRSKEDKTSSESESHRARKSRPSGNPKSSRRHGSPTPSSSSSSISSIPSDTETAEPTFQSKTAQIMSQLPPGIDRLAAAQILHEVLLSSSPTHWTDIAGLTAAKQALKEAVVYPFLRPDLFRGLREPAKGVLLFGPPGTGKTMLARAVATESGATFFSISASSLLSKWLGDSERLVRALFALARVMAPSVVFVDEIDSLLSTRDSGGDGGSGPSAGKGESEATRRVKTEFLIQWSALSEPLATTRHKTASEAVADKVDPPAPPQVLILAATNTPWSLDPAARRRFVRRTYIPLPDIETRRAHIRALMAQSQSAVSESDLEILAEKTAGYSGSDIAALARDAALAPIRELGEEALLSVGVNDIRGVERQDWESGMQRVRASVGTESLERYEEWASEWGERGS